MALSPFWLTSMGKLAHFASLTPGALKGDSWVTLPVHSSVSDAALSALEDEFGGVECEADGAIDDIACDVLRHVGGQIVADPKQYRRMSHDQHSEMRCCRCWRKSGTGPVQRRDNQFNGRPRAAAMCRRTFDKGSGSRRGVPG
jgi:hypothetical protein